MQAATDAELREPFVRIMVLGDHSITYRVSGLLVDVRQLLSARSRLARRILDVLHENGIEIVSPAFVNQRRMAGDVRIIPECPAEADEETGHAPENIVFDKAEQAEMIEKRKLQLLAELTGLESALAAASEASKPSISSQVQQCREQLAALEAPAPGSGRS